MATIDSQLSIWAQAKLSGDVEVLNGLLHPDILAVSPYGFLLNREEWTSRFANGLRYESFTFDPDIAARTHGETTVLVGTQRQRGYHLDREIDGELRTSC